MKNTKVKYSPEELILHIPHSSRYIPDNCRNLFYLNDDELQRELLKMTDSYTDEIFNIPSISDENRIVFPYSRLICDVERFRDDEQESMAKLGMGVCYTRTSDLTQLKSVNEEHRQKMLKLYDNHHEALTDAVDSSLVTNERAMIIDCHSFSSVPLPYEKASSNNRNSRGPDICIGTDDFHTPKWLEKYFVNAFRERGYIAAVNYPYAGAIVPMKHYGKDDRVSSVMIEVNRSLYMDEITGDKLNTFDKVRNDIREVIEGIMENNMKINI